MTAQIQTGFGRINSYIHDIYDGAAIDRQGLVARCWANVNVESSDRVWQRYCIRLGANSAFAHAYDYF